jgi:HPt (histidine-containing phosphotransfer) domain-containing protein
MKVDRTPPEALSDSDILIAWGCNSDGLIAWSSPAWRRFTGISVEQQIKHRWQTCLHPEDESTFDNGASGDNGQEPRMAREFRLLHHDGTFHQVLGYVRFSLEQTSSETGLHAACFEIQTIASSDVDVAATYQQEESQQDLLLPTDHPLEFNHQAIRDLFDNDERSLRELAELFDTTCEESLDFLATGFNSPNQHDLFSTAHRLKGAIANMNAPQVLESCQRLEAAIQANEISTAEIISQQVIRAVAQLRNMVKQEFTP